MPIGVCDRFVDPNWAPAECYRTIQTAVLKDTLFALGRGGNGVELYEWDMAAAKWSPLIDTAQRFADPTWAKPQYYETIHTAVAGGKLFLLGRGAAGVEIYRYEGRHKGWSKDSLGRCERFADPNWAKPEYCRTIQTAVVGDSLYLLGRGSSGVEIYEWQGDSWSSNLATASRFKDPNWAKPQYYETIGTVVDGSNLWIYVRGAGGVEFYRWTGVGWNGPLPTCTRFADPNWASSRVYWGTIKGFVCNDQLHVMGRGAKGIEIYRLNGQEWKLLYGPIERFDDASLAGTGLPLPGGIFVAGEMVYLWSVALA
jgi:hypothetical protein